VGNHVYVERADPNAKGYEEGTRRRRNVIDRYLWANRFVHGITIDMPCGMGWGTSLITNVKLLYGIDICSEAVYKAKMLFPYKAHFLVEDMLGTHFPSNFFDSVICCEGYEHVGRRAQFLLMKEIYRIIRPDGVVLLTVPLAKRKGDPTDNEFHLYEPTIEEVEETLINKFEIIELTKPNVVRYRLRVIK